MTGLFSHFSHKVCVSFSWSLLSVAYYLPPLQFGLNLEWITDGVRHPRDRTNGLVLVCFLGTWSVATLIQSKTEASYTCFLHTSWRVMSSVEYIWLHVMHFKGASDTIVLYVGGKTHILPIIFSQGCILLRLLSSREHITSHRLALRRGCWPDLLPLLKGTSEARGLPCSLTRAHS